jgi:hypothetical protein
MNLRKDHALNLLAESGNVAQFVSFAPLSGADAEQTHSRLWRYSPNHRFGSAAEAIRTLLASSPDGSVNLRSFAPDNPRSREFLYGISDPNVAIDHLNRLIGGGLFVIANETVDVSDGGVSGVVEGGVIEFSPDDTPRCVEKSGTVSLPLADGISMLQTTYGFPPELPECNGFRVEFSIHPKPRGYKRTHTLIWEYERVATCNQKPNVSWPNNLSRMIGDKAFGLLIADLLGMNVPRSLVIGRRVRPFAFGRETGSNETWLRTCPVEQNPGRYTTAPSWIDPFKLLATEDPEHNAIASIISQAAVPAQFSGAAITKKDGRLHVEGTAGSGENFMLGRTKAQRLPDSIVHAVLHTNQRLRERLGHVRFEWVHDVNKLWIVQLHKGKTSSTSTTIVPGEATEWATFQTESGLEALRQLLACLAPHIGLLLEGEVGLTSHLADLARKAARPTRLIRPKATSPQPTLFDLSGANASEDEEL